MDFLSDFFSTQLKAKDTFNNGLTFTYPDYSSKCVSTFLDIVHGMELDFTDDYATTLELIKFLQYEGKSGESWTQASDLSATVLATSEFEKQLLESLCTMISQSDKILMTEKLMMILACNTFDDFNNAIDSFEKVRRINCTSCYECIRFSVSTTRAKIRSFEQVIRLIS